MEPSNTTPTSASATSQTENLDATAYWHANLKLIGGLLSIWFVVSFGFGILLVDELNKIQFFGFKLGFWWAQQGSIYVFVILIFAYVFFMQRIDRRFGVSDADAGTK